MAGSAPPRGACACVCEQPCPGVGVPPRRPPCCQGRGGDTFVSPPPPRQGLVGQKVLRRKTIAEREIQLVKGLVAISQALKKREGEERGKGRGGTFLWPFLFIYFASLPRWVPLPSPPPRTSLDMPF